LGLVIAWLVFPLIPVILEDMYYQTFEYGDHAMLDRFRAGTVLSMVVGLSLTLAAVPCARARGGDGQDKEIKVEGDLKKMQGEWLSKDEQGAESTWTFKGDRLSIKAPGRGYEIMIKLDPKAAPEKHMDFAVRDDSPNAMGSKAEGIYKFTDDGKLLVCFSSPEGSRPKEFKTDFGSSFSFELKKK
jgi:uncharacterized protein (TIGR03067 family)